MSHIRKDEQQIYIDNITFSVSELISLYFLKQIVKPYKNLDVGNTASAMIEKLLEKAPSINQAYIDRIEDLIKVNPLEGITEKYIDGEWIKTIREAIEKNHRLKIEYFSFNSGEITRRRIDPYFLEIREGCYHLVGFCHLRREVRDFRVSRIKKLEMIEETYKRPENFYENYNQTRFDKLAGDEPINLKIVFDGLAAKYIKEYESHKADTIADLGNGKILFDKKTTYTSDILQWVLRFGADAEVLEPEALRFEVTWEAERMVQKYKGK